MSRNEAEAAKLMPEGGLGLSFLEERVVQAFRRQSVNSLLDKIGPDQQSSGMSEDPAAGEPPIESYEEAVRGGRKSVKAPAHQERVNREQPLSSSPEPRESSTHAKQVVETNHRPTRLPRDMKSSAPTISGAGRRQEPYMAMRPSPRTTASHEENVLDAGFLSTSTVSRELGVMAADILPIPNRERPNPLGVPALELSDVGRGTPPPTIHVSIGRIEVRATTASAPSKKNQAKSSAMSLDEYLARRREGRR